MGKIFQTLGLIENFREGRWLEHHVRADETTKGKVLTRATNARAGSNALISIVEWVQRK